MPKDFDMIIRINSERAEIEVERHSKKGVISRKNISPQSLSNCILTSRVDDESHPTGLLPEGCIAVVMEKKHVYYYIRYPELHADFSYYETEYPDFPIPRLVFCFKYLPSSKKVAEKAAFKFTYNGRWYDRLSLSEKIRAGMEVSELVKRLTGRNYPVFVDNMESVDDLANVHPTGQVIMAKCVRGAPLEVRPLRPIPVVGQKAA